MLDGAANDAYYSLSLGRFPASENKFGGIELRISEVLRERVDLDLEESARELAGATEDFVASDAEVIVFWGNLIIPTVAMPGSLAAAHAERLIEIGDDVWVFSPVDEILIEYWHNGSITVVRVPG
ncbi:hypothetical protein [Amycolatopsis aidingensis]|uniref:hypothetical protein n=1 Tax=Amycolatopsis aidingensis TaxID=2842453 RepID=UPI001C0C2179|nr:hypothetical protein [Amycolatopsis aidingensis]